MAELGVLSKVNPRTEWKNEARDFTPWLAQEENIQRLGDALGIELEVENTEVAVGPFSADILARDTGTGDYVVIENQLEKTDHDHLGKMITYSAFLRASAAVWLAPHFTDEHRKALDWLNDNSSDEIAFYGVVVELWQIDDSRPAIRFNVVSRPPELLRRATLAQQAVPLTESRKLQLEWWTAVREALQEANALPSYQTPRPQYWYDVALGRSGINLSNTANTFDGKIGIRVYISNKANAVAAIEQLLDQRSEIEEEIGAKLDWDPNPEARDKTIVLLREAELADRDKWPTYIAWMVEHIIKFRKAFAPRVKRLDLSIGSTIEDTD